MHFSTQESYSKVKKKKHQPYGSRFYLDQPEEATTAKNDLLSLTHNFETNWFDSYNSTKGSSSCMKTYCNSVESWHGQTLKQNYQKINKQPKNTKILVKVQKQNENHKRRNTLDGKKRTYLKSGHLLQNLNKFSQQNIRNVKKRSKSSVDWQQHNNKIISMIPRLNQSIASFREHRVNSMNLKKKKTIKPTSLHFRTPKEQSKQWDKNNNTQFQQMDQNMKINSVLKTSFNNIESKQATQKGLLGSTLRKNDQKGRWITYRNNPSNISRVYKIQTNSPLKKQLSKIMDLLKQQDNFNKIIQSQ